MHFPAFTSFFIRDGLVEFPRLSPHTTYADGTGISCVGKADLCRWNGHKSHASPKASARYGESRGNFSALTPSPRRQAPPTAPGRPRPGHGARRVSRGWPERWRPRPGSHSTNNTSRPALWRARSRCIFSAGDMGTPDDTTPRCNRKNARIDVICFAHSRPHSTAVRGRSGGPQCELSLQGCREALPACSYFHGQDAAPAPNRALWLHEIKHDGFLGVVARKNCNRAAVQSPR
jgi:hypothetical protein